jgi:hypothetical protein
VLLAVPQTPGPVAVFAAAQVAVPALAWQYHVHCPLPLSSTAVAVPTVHRLTDGAEPNPPPFAVPHAPIGLPTGAEQDAVAPAFVPEHCHDQMLPAFATADGVPAAHKAVGVTVEAAPFAAPH